MAGCDAQTLLNLAIANGYDKLSDRDLKEALVAAACGGSGVPGATGGLFVGVGSPEGVVTAPPGSIYTQLTAGGAFVAQWTKLTGTGNTGWQ